MILAGDVGGTKVHLALYNFAGGRLVQVREEKFPAHEFATLDDVVNKFLASDDGAKREQIAAACFGCPGPVRDGRLKLTNLPWTLDARELTPLVEDRAHLSDQRPGSERLRDSGAGAGAPSSRCIPGTRPRWVIAD